MCACVSGLAVYALRRVIFKIILAIYFLPSGQNYLTHATQIRVRVPQILTLSNNLLEEEVPRNKQLVFS